MNNTLIILHPWQQQMLTLPLANKVTVANNYNAIPITNYSLVIDATEQWKNIIKVANSTSLFFVNEPIELNNNLPLNTVRFNGWATFFNNTTLEYSGTLPNETKLTIENILGKTLLLTTDTIGLISGSIIAGIINEAYNALENNVGTKEAIDTAMKLGTNYPYGPFEWANKIGHENIKTLLLAKQKQNPAYITNKLILNP